MANIRAGEPGQNKPRRGAPGGNAGQRQKPTTPQMPKGPVGDPMPRRPGGPKNPGPVNPTGGSGGTRRGGSNGGGQPKPRNTNPTGPNPNTPDGGGGGPSPKPGPNASSYASFKKAVRTPGMQMGEQAAIQTIMKNRSVTAKEAQQIAKRRTAKGLNVARIQGPKGPKIGKPVIQTGGGNS